MTSCSRDWHSTVDINVEGVAQLKGALGEAESMARSLNSLLFCVKDRTTRIRRRLNVVALESYFPLLSDDVLAMIFEFAATPFSQETGDEYDNKTPSRISQVCRRFRNIALGLPHLWRYIDVKSDLQVIASRSAKAGPILEVQVKSELGDSDKRNDQLYSFLGRIVAQSCRITHIRLDLCPRLEQGFLTKLRKTKEFASLSFPSLNELVLNFEDTKSDSWNLHFYKLWDMPVLSAIEAHNVIPEFHSSAIYAGVTKCSLKLDEIKGQGGRWLYSDVLQFLSKLSRVVDLDILLHGDSMFAMYDAAEIVSLPTVVRLKTAFPAGDKYSIENFFLSTRTPNKKLWVLEIKLDKWVRKFAILILLATIVSDAQLWQTLVQTSGDYQVLRHGAVH